MTADAWGRDADGWRNSAKVVRGQAMNACPCGQPIRTHIGLCEECQSLVDRYWRDLGNDSKGARA